MIVLFFLIEKMKEFNTEAYYGGNGWAITIDNIEFCSKK